jgi:hypothetical protein
MWSLLRVGSLGGNGHKVGASEQGFTRDRVHAGTRDRVHAGIRVHPSKSPGYLEAGSLIELTARATVESVMGKAKEGLSVHDVGLMLTSCTVQAMKLYNMKV